MIPNTYVPSTELCGKRKDSSTTVEGKTNTSGISDVSADSYQNLSILSSDEQDEVAN